MVKAIGPGVALSCIMATTCDCGHVGVTQGSIYMCEQVGPGGILHHFFCEHDACDGNMVAVLGKEHAFCASCFAPLDDGDTSLVEEEGSLPYDKMVEAERLKRKHGFEDAPAKPETVPV